MSWRVIGELMAFGGMAGLAGAAVRFANPERRRLGKCVLWELPSAAMIGAGGYAAAAELFAFGEYGRFLVGFAAGYLGHAALHDLAVSALAHYRARLLSATDAQELADRRAQQPTPPPPKP
jgi:hypothetical protein